MMELYTEKEEFEKVIEICMLIYKNDHFGTMTSKGFILNLAHYINAEMGPGYQNISQSLLDSINDRN